MDTPKRTPLRNKHLENVFGNILGTPLKIPPSPQLQKLGFGTGIEVCRVNRTPSKDVVKSPWAVKRLNRFALDGDMQNSEVYSERLEKEAMLLRKLNHGNIVGFRAYKKGPDGRNILALEICDSSLADILEKRLEEDMGPLEVPKIARFCLDIAAALEYLHKEMEILHGDIKSGNVLVKGDFEVCKLCDFGVSLKIDKSGHIDPDDKYVGTDLWAAPEVIDDMTSLIGSGSDIFSYGLVIYETFVLMPPHFFGLDDEDSMTELDMRVGTRPPLPETLELSNDYNLYVGLFYACTKDLPEDRPSAEAIQKMLK
ncbi:lymphokine-activated killer T-cell-originated protein kinase homolog [Phlebotomus argentipes]|uniref:lymphokine-activated killer T-cell-originated protein kinase homolog n=1 Tax=Phlebotomus argentipes TaxID=94469 RepID=UPI002893724A|nr:lymphokine-activated killer T-cell-originated protein kinase homolog [Phlebotomus argentipes]